MVWPDTCWAASGDNDAGPDPFAPIFSVQTGVPEFLLREDRSLDPERLRARPGPHLPVVIITTRGSAAERRACLDAGADAFIDKSKFRGDELVETLRRLVE